MKRWNFERMYGGLYWEDFEVVAALRACPEARGRACGVLALDPGAVVERVKLPLVAVNGAARRTGIGAGWPLNRALVRCPDLRVLAPDPAAEADLLREMIALAEGFTPDLEVAAKDTLLLDLSRATERQLAGLAEPGMAGLRLVRAATPDLARLAVRAEECAGRFISPEEMKGLPLDLLGALPGGRDLLALLEGWGLRVLGDFMRLPRQALAERLGPAAGEGHDVLWGRSCRLLRLHRPPESLAQELDFEEPVNSLEALVFSLKRLLHTLEARLAARHVAVRVLRLGLRLEDGGAVERVLRLAEPRTADLLEPLRVMLEAMKLRAAVGGISLDVEITEPTGLQRDWWLRQLPRPERWGETLARLEAMLGEGRTGIPVPPGSHRPDDFRLLPGDGGGEWKGGAGLPSCSVPLRRLRPPREVAVAFEAGPRPLALLTGPYRGEIGGCRGPFRTSGEWWDPERSWQRLEWDVRVADGLLRLVFEPPERWWVEGVYGAVSAE